jgi:large repetitive protein
MNGTSSLAFSAPSRVVNSENPLGPLPGISASPGQEGRASLHELRAHSVKRTSGGRRWWIATASFLLFAMGGFAQSPPPPFTFPAWVPVGTTSAPVSITVGSQGAGSVSRVDVLTQGATALDFADVGGSCLGASFTGAGQTCTESVAFTPKYPGTHVGAVVLLGSGSTVLGIAYVSGIGQGGQSVLSPGWIVTAAGSGAWKAPQDGPALSASLYLPTSVALDELGNMYIADSLHNRIRKVDTTQTISTFAGTGAASDTGDGGPAVNATLNTPSGIALDGAGNLFIADTGNNLVREIEQSTGIIRTVAGTGAQGNMGDGGPATSAQLNQPLGITVDIAGNLFIADTGNNRIRRVDVYSGVITNFAGSADGLPGNAGDTGLANQGHLNGPNAVAFDAAGNMFIPDSLNNLVRVVWASGTIATFAGGGSSLIEYGPSATLAKLDTPSSVLVDAAQNIYIADTQNEAIRKVYAVSGYFTTIAQFGFTGGFFDGTMYEQSLYGPEGLARDGNGNIFFADVFNNKIREIRSDKIILDFTYAPIHVGDTAPDETQFVENDGNSQVTLSSITPDVNAALDNTIQNNCVIGAPGYGPVSGCVIAAQFKPTITGDPLDAHITVETDSGNSPLDIELAGAAIPATPTTLTLTGNPNPSAFEASVTFEATVTPAPPADTKPNTIIGTPSGTVTFSADGTSIGSAPLDSTGRATLNYSALTVGTHAITASYAGTNDFMASNSAPLSQVVQPMPTVTSLAGSSDQLVATVVGTTSTTPIPTGTVTFVSGNTTLGTATLNANGAATLNPQMSAAGSTIIANYSGDAVHSPSSSVAVTISSIPLYFGIALSPPKVTMAAGQNATINVTVTSNNGYSDTIGLGCSSLPAAVNCHFSNNNVALTAGGSISVQLTIDTNSPLAGGSSAMNSSAATRGFNLAGLFLPSGLLFGCILGRSRKRNRALFTAALVLLLSSAFLVTGCAGGFTQSSAAPGTYNIEITGLGVNSNVAHYQPFTLTITK